MEVRLHNPAVEQFIETQVREGHYPSITAAVEAAIERMMSEEQLDDAAIDAIQRADAQLGRGEGMDFHLFATQFRKQHGMD